MNRPATRLIEPLARFGYAAKGLVYGLVGVLAVQAALQTGGGTEGTQGAIETIGSQPFGRVLLVLTALGLLGYAVWRFTSALYDPDHPGERDAASYIRRAGFAAVGFAYVGLALFAARLALGDGGGGGGDSEESWAQTLMQQPLGRWLVAAVGLTVVGAGLVQFIQAYRASFMKHYRTGEMGASERVWAERVGRFGLAARGVTFLLIGFFFLQAAWRASPREAGGLGEAFRTLASQPYGPYLLGLVALGFVAYGLHCFAHARYRSFNV